MKSIFKAGFLSVSLAIASSAVSFGQQKVEWNGYLQSRFSDDFRSTTGFSIRRAKLWVDGSAANDLSFRVQGIFRYQTSGTFMLQDVYGQYRLPFGFVRAGQFVPDFSLERSQGDAVIPLVERAAVINALIPSGDTYARDIGAEFVLEPASSGFHTSFGVYNGNGGNTKGSDDRQLLYTDRTTYDIHITEGVSWTSGFSLAYRDKKDLTFSSILGSGKTFSGQDFRWGLETHLKSGNWEVQAEYLQADLESLKSYGYYVMGDYTFDPMNEIALSTERLEVPNPSAANEPWYIADYTHFFNGQKEKVIVDARAQRSTDRTSYAATVQFQFYFN